MSQNPLAQPTTGTLSGLSLVEGLNGAIDTLNTLSAGAAAPSSPEAGQPWHDTTHNVLNIRSLDNTTWIPIGSVDETNYRFAASLGAAITVIANGGTGASTASAALANLVTGSNLANLLNNDFLGIAQGGTGATSAAAALTALLAGSVVPQANGGTGVTNAASLFGSGGNSDSSGAAYYWLELPNGWIFNFGKTGNISASSSGVYNFGTYGKGLSNGVYFAHCNPLFSVDATFSGSYAPYGVNTSQIGIANNTSQTAPFFWAVVGT